MTKHTEKLKKCTLSRFYVVVYLPRSGLLPFHVAMIYSFGVSVHLKSTLKVPSDRKDILKGRKQQLLQQQPKKQEPSWPQQHRKK
jgi:hypothetical protein